MLEEEMGQLIAELSKFGGFEKKKSNQLARIILEHIRANYISKAEVIKAIPEKKPKVIKRKGFYPPYQPQVEQHERRGFNQAIEDFKANLGLE